MIVFVGPYPPPYGGVSIFIKRMKEYLDCQGIENQIWDISNVHKAGSNIIPIKLRYVPFYYLIRRDVDLIHYNINISGTKIRDVIGFFHRFMFKNRKKITTLHEECKRRLFNGINDEMTVKFLNTFDTIICIKSGDKNELMRRGICSNVYEIPAFIPPTIKEEEVTEIPQNVRDFMNQHTPVISANAFRIVFHNNEDLYGIDMCIDLCANLKDTYPEVGLVFCLPDIGDYDYFQKMKQRISEKGIEKNFLFQTKPCQLYPITIKSDVFVRPTITDGYGVSVAEAVHFRIPAVASDVCPRAEGTILFKNRNISDFTLKVKDVLNHYKFHRKRIRDIKLANNAEEILKIYKKLMDG